MKKKDFKFLDHTADIKFKAYGDSIEKLFENCITAISNVLVGDQKIKSKIEKKIIVNGSDHESVLRNLINEILYLVDAKGFIVTNAKVKVKNFRVSAKLYGNLAKNYGYINQIKSATYAEMYVKKTSKNWIAQVVLDV